MWCLVQQVRSFFEYRGWFCELVRIARISHGIDLQTPRSVAIDLLDVVSEAPRLYQDVIRM